MESGGEAVAPSAFHLRSRGSKRDARCVQPTDCSLVRGLRSAPSVSHVAAAHRLTRLTPPVLYVLTVWAFRGHTLKVASSRSESKQEAERNANVHLWDEQVGSAHGEIFSAKQLFFCHK